MGRFDDYSGMLTAFPYAFRRSDSRLFRSYVVVSAVLGALVVLGMAAALLVLLGNTSTARGGTLTLSRTFYVVVALFVFLPLVAPVLFVARRYRRERAVAERYDAALAAAGYAFVVSVYLGLVASSPPQYRDEPAGVLAPAVEALYAIPPALSLVLPASGAILVYLVHRRLG